LRFELGLASHAMWGFGYGVHANFQNCIAVQGTKAIGERVAAVAAKLRG
jgi:hypothetical protein